MFINSILGGLCIAIGTLVYLSIGEILGACLFSIGILTIMLNGFNLYTGRIGFIESYKEIPSMLFIILGNFIGCSLLLLFPNPIALEIVLTKISYPLWFSFVKSVLCGILIYVSVDAYRKNNLFVSFLAIPVFITIGAEHSIANFCFFFAARYFSWYLIPFSIVVILGNAFGSIIFHQLKRIRK